MTLEVNYPQLATELTALIDDERNSFCLLANSAALLFERLPQINWLGFYLLKEETLVLGPFQGKVACSRILPDKGVCGQAVASRQPIRVDDVEQFPGHIACDKASRSELVIPIWCQSQLIGVLDIDSPLIARFTEQDEKGLTLLANIIDNHLELTDCLAVISQMSL